MRAKRKRVMGRVCLAVCLLMGGWGIMEAWGDAAETAYLTEVNELTPWMQQPDFTLEKLDERLAELLKKYPSDAQRGGIYRAAAVRLANGRPKYPEKYAELAAKALELEKDPVKRARLHSYWGDMLQIKHRGIKGEEMSKARREVAVQYFLGIKEVDIEPLPEVKQEVSGGKFYDFKGKEPPADMKEMVEKSNKEYLENMRIRRVNDLIFERDIGVMQLTSIYNLRPTNSEEMEALAKEHLSPAMAEFVIDKVHAGIKRSKELVLERQAKAATRPAKVETKQGKEAPGLAERP